MSRTATSVIASNTARTAARSFAAAVNHLLAREPWARERLAAYAGKRARLRGWWFDATTTIGHDGLLSIAPAAGAPLPDDVTLTIPADALFALLRGGPAAVAKQVRIEGDAEFAATLAKLAEQLRWDPEDDLSRLLGDAPAHHLATAARTMMTGASRASRGLAGMMSEYWVDEAGWLVRRTMVDAFSAGVAALRDDLARLEKRVERLNATGAGLPAPRERGTSPRAAR
jgi:ubiquinone biosynthesis protein UbiJ